MRYYYYLLLTLILFCSCNTQVQLDGKLKDQHVFVQNTGCYLIPPDDFKETRDYYGFQDRSFKWSISIEKSGKSMERYNNMYSKKNLKALKRELLSSKEVLYNSEFTGKLHKYKSPRKGLLNYALILELGDKRIHIKSWMRDNEKVKTYDDQILNSLKSLVIANEESITDDMNNPFTVNTDVVYFKNKNDRGQYLYSKIENSNDNFKLAIWDDKRGFSVSQYPNDPLEFNLGKGYKKVKNIVIDEGWMHKSQAWIGQSEDKENTAIVGYNDFGMGKRVRYSISYTNDFEENFNFSKSLIKSIKWYK